MLQGPAAPCARFRAIVAAWDFARCPWGTWPRGRLAVFLGRGAMRVDPVELSWVGDAFGPPLVAPVPDWRLAEWVRTQAGPRHKRFYDSARWLALRRRVIAEAHGASLYELSLAPSRYVPATCVHHVMRVAEHPEWALSEWAVDGRGRVVRNLIPLSHLGHDVAHGRCGFGAAPRPRPLTDERW